MPINWLGFTVIGRAKACAIAPNGKNLILCYFVSEGTIGYIEFITGIEQATATLIAISDFECITIPCDVHEEYLRTNIEFLNKQANELAIKLVQNANNFISAALYIGEEHLCSYILQTSNNDNFNDVLTDVSCSVGMSYRHLFRLLHQFCEEKLLKKQENRYRIIDKETLIRRANASKSLSNNE